VWNLYALLEDVFFVDRFDCSPAHFVSVIASALPLFMQFISSSWAKKKASQSSAGAHHL
jgi:hypothetical protein